MTMIIIVITTQLFIHGQWNHILVTRTTILIIVTTLAGRLSHTIPRQIIVNPTTVANVVAGMLVMGAMKSGVFGTTIVVGNMKEIRVTKKLF